jgi:hypothetical protein
MSIDNFIALYAGIEIVCFGLYGIIISHTIWKYEKSRKLPLTDVSTF